MFEDCFDGEEGPEGGREGGEEDAGPSVASGCARGSGCGVEVIDMEEEDMSIILAGWSGRG
jgi:hypothetical protein